MSSEDISDLYISDRSALNKTYHLISGRETINTYVPHLMLELPVGITGRKSISRRRTRSVYYIVYYIYILYTSEYTQNSPARARQVILGSCSGALAAGATRLELPKSNRVEYHCSHQGAT